MHDALLKFIQERSFTPLTEADISLIQELFVHQKLRKRQFLLKEGDACKYLAFVVKGALRQYTVDDKGVEHIVSLHIENWWTGDRESYVKNTPSIYNIDAWEDTDLLLLPRANSERIYGICAFMEMRVKLDENYSIASQRRLTSAISHSAEHRYQELIKTYPAFLQRFPQHIIASYLGITKETLSRVRNQYVKR
ncbi:MAG: Crp/Fnr family transcriptional regulator [Taibaiella sp.]|jgi:CRP-like cAMP-binding protein